MVQIIIDKILQRHINNSVRQALEEDIGQGDITACLIDRARHADARIISRETAVVCGIPWVNEVLSQVDASALINWQVKEGDTVKGGDCLCALQGPARSLLTAERTALNFLQTLSATATTTNFYANLIADTTCRILDTRKTIPGLRLAQKYAVRTGGGENHRTGLYDGILIKENHIRSAGSIQKALHEANQLCEKSILIEIEVETLEELEQALAAGAQRIMLDNFSIENLSRAVKLNQSRAKLEASGNISAENLRDIAQTGVDYISLGALTKHVQAIDLSMQFND